MIKIVLFVLFQRIEWHSTRAHRELCALKGKSPEVDCQNYLRIAARAQDGKTIVCGTNAYKPLCRHYHPRPDGRLHKNEEFEGTGLCPYDPEHNSTAIYTSKLTKLINYLCFFFHHS